MTIAAYSLGIGRAEVLLSVHGISALVAASEAAFLALKIT